LPAQLKGGLALNLSHLPAGTYAMETHKVGYRVNDPHTTYRDLGAPAQLTKDQVSKIKAENDGAPVEVRTVEIGPDGKFEHAFELRENDAVLITFTPQP
jgi:xylan 1,4-beta-xylosidase